DDLGIGFYDDIAVVVFEPLALRIIRADAPGLDRLAHDHSTSDRRQCRGQRRGGDGLADAGVRSRDEENARDQLVVSAAQVSAIARMRPQAWASSSGSSPARAVSRRRVMPSGTEGGRKQPTIIPSSRSSPRARTPDSGLGIGTESTAPAGTGTSSAAASSARADAIEATRSDVMSSSAACAAAAPAGARPVSKIRQRAVLTAASRMSADPSRAPPWEPSAFDRVAV